MTRRVNIDDTDIDDSLGWIVDGEYFTGEIFETLSTGEVVALFSVVDGDEHGRSRQWYRDGTLKSETYVVRGRVAGISREWHPNGVLAEEREFDERGRYVAQRCWNPDGEEVGGGDFRERNGPSEATECRPARRNIDDAAIDDAMAYLIDGEWFTGELVETLKSGQIIELTTVTNGMVDGIQRAWFGDGTLKYEANVVNSRVVGVSRQWHPNGVLAEECEFDERGKLVAERTWTPDGEPERR